MDIKKLKKRLTFLNAVFWPGFYCKPFIRFINNQKVKTFENALIPEIQPLIEKYSSYNYTEEPIGNRIWVFWYTGIDSAPPIVRKCISEMEKINDIDLIILDKNNLNKYFTWDNYIKKKFEAGKISITMLSDIIRNQLMSVYGGFWFDSTLMFFDKNFVIDHKGLSYYSIKHSDYAACSHFSEGKWSTFLIGTQKNHLLPSFTSDVYKWFFNKYDDIPDYFFTDYIYYLAYETFSSIKKEIDSLPTENSDVFYIGRNIKKRCSDDTWDTIRSQNKV